MQKFGNNKLKDFSKMKQFFWRIFEHVWTLEKEGVDLQRQEALHSLALERMNTVLFHTYMITLLIHNNWVDEVQV